MARYNEILVGRYNRFMQKFLSMKGPASLVTLSDEMQAVFSFFHGVENRYLEGWQRFGVTFDVAASAGNQGGLRMRNATGSNVVAAFEKILIGAVATDSFQVFNGPATTDLASAAALSGARLDSRGPNQNPSLIGSFQNNAVSVPSLANVTLRAFLTLNTSFDFITEVGQEIPLLPGDALQVTPNNVNERFVCSLIWRERFLEDSERA